MKSAYHGVMGWVRRLCAISDSGHDRETSACSARVQPAPPPPRPRATVDGDDDRAKLVQRFMDQGRIAILLRPQIAATLDEQHLAVVRKTFEQEMARLDASDVLVSPWTLDDVESALANVPRRRETISSCYLDRNPVTNRQFHDFVADGGYGQQSLWETAVWSRVGEFTDQTQRPSPRFWKNGMYADGEGELPVVGINWFEADAYARWSGRRLPTDGEWLMAATCPVITTNSELVQRRFPWGDALDPHRANLGMMGLGRPNAVHEFLEGSSAHGINQLIGNVWEWTASDLVITSYGKEVHFDVPIKSLRGGSFDTYFESQATCQFQSGESALARRHNLGFRCALSARDIIPWGVSA